MRLSYDRAFEMRSMIADPPPIPAEPKVEKKKDLELIIAHLLEQAKQGKFRKRGNIVYQQKHVCWVGARYATNAWVPASFGSERGEEQHTIESFVLYFCKKDLYPEMHSAIARSLPVKKVADFLMICDESDFPFVKPQRNLLCFKNGVYDTNGPGLGAFYEYENGCNTLLGDKAAAKYFDVAMPSDAFDISLGCRSSGWWDIATPLFQCPVCCMSRPRVRAFRACEPRSFLSPSGQFWTTRSGASHAVVPRPRRMALRLCCRSGNGRQPLFVDTSMISTWSSHVGSTISRASRIP
jgi:hypothetical protein